MGRERRGREERVMGGRAEISGVGGKGQRQMEKEES